MLADPERDHLVEDEEGPVLVAQAAHGLEVGEADGPLDRMAGDGDVLGHDRLLPPTREGDVLLVADTGAYGHAMASQYTLRPPPVEVVI